MTDSKPNILVIWGDDIGITNLSCYSDGLMGYRTPNIDRIADEGMRFTDSYGEQSCTAGRSSFITGQSVFRTGLSKVGIPGADVGLRAEDPTIAEVLKPHGYATGQFGKNHLGDKNEFLPCLHGFDEYSGYLYHLDAMEDPFWHSYPAALKDVVGPRNVVSCTATATDDTTEHPRWGKVGRQRIVDEGPLPPRAMPGVQYNMETYDEVVRDKTIAFIDQAAQANKPFFAWMNPTRVHVITHLSPQYQAKMTPENGWYTNEAAMAQLDDNVGAVMEHLRQRGMDQNTIVVFTTDNGTENFTWPDGGNTPFAGGKGTAMEGGFRAPAIIRWPGRVAPGTVHNGLFSGLDWFPTLVAAAGNPNITQQLLDGRELGGKTYKVHLDGYDQTAMLTGQGPSKRNEVIYFTEGTLSAVRLGDWKFRLTDQPDGWTGGTVKLDMPLLTHLRLDPFERMGFPKGRDGAWGYGMDFFVHEFWRFVFLQQEVAKAVETFIEYPPMQRGASFNLEAVKAQVEAAVAAARRARQ